MKKLYLLIVIISLAIFAGCSKDDNPANPSTKGNISGKITEQGTGNEISGASISTQPATTTVTSDNAGNYSITNIEAGNYTLTVTMNGYFPNTANVSVTANQTSTSNISLSIIPPDPIASFTYTGGTVTPATINFQNNSQNANSYLWEFGDGSTSTQENPSKTYNQHGTYTVTLTANNTVTGDFNQTSQNITITPGKVFLQRVIVDEFPFLDVNSVPWDNFSGPDLYFTISDSLTNIQYTAVTYYEDLTQGNLPVQWDLSPEFEFLGWGKTFYIDLWDYDPADPDDYIGYVGFKINQFVSSNYPTTVSLQRNQTNGTIRIRIGLRWQ